MLIRDILHYLRDGQNRQKIANLPKYRVYRWEFWHFEVQYLIFHLLIWSYISDFKINFKQFKFFNFILDKNQGQE